MKHEIIKFYHLKIWYVKHKHDMDPNSNINYSRKIAPVAPILQLWVFTDFYGNLWSIGIWHKIPLTFSGL